MAGGKRPGAGRKPGEAWKGAAPRPPGVRDLAKARVRQVLNSSDDPLAILCEIASDREVDVQIRVTAASAAAPFMFPRLSASVVAMAPATSRDETSGLVERLMRRFDLMAPKPAETVDATLVEMVGADADADAE